MDSTLHSINIYLPLCWNNEQLAKLRLGWERKSVNSWHLYRSPTADTVIVLVERLTNYPEKSYSLNRYFKLGDNWVMSRDLEDGSLDAALSAFEAWQGEQVPA